MLLWQRDAKTEMRFSFFKSGTKSAADQCCKTGLWGSLAIVGVCCVTPLLLGLVGLAFLKPFVDSYVLFPLLVFFLLLGLYGWIYRRRLGQRGRADIELRMHR
jgi:hypothetical protein